MFRVIRAEIKKILSRPATYILAFFLAVILILANLVYKPTQQIAYDSPIISTNATANEKYSYFYNEGMKSNLDNDLQKIVDSVDDYKESNSAKDQITEKLNNIKTAYEDYKLAILVGANENNLSSDDIKSNQEKLLDAIKALDIKIEQIKSQYNSGIFLLLSTKSNYSKFTDLYEELIDWASTVLVKKSSVGEYFSLYQDDLLPRLENVLSHFKYPTLSDSTIKTYTENIAGTKYHILNNRLSQIIDDIEKIKDNTYSENLTSKESSELMNSKINLYKNEITTYISLIKYDLLSNAFTYTNNAEELDLVYISDHYSQYNVNSLKERYNFLFDNNKVDLDYALPLTIGSSSNPETNAYDYAYFVLRLFSFVIVVFAVTLASRTIAGEAQEGTLRFLAIKPISRRDLYLGKLLAILILSIILLIFCTIIAIAVGGALYGFDSRPILTIFNGTTPIVMQPYTMIIIYLLSFIIELIIYLSIAIFLSSLFKADVLPLTLVLVLYAINIILPVFVGSVNTWLTYYIFSHTSIYALFGSPVFAPTNYDFFSKILGAKIYTGNNIGLTITICVLLISIINILGCKLFKKKEL